MRTVNMGRHHERRRDSGERYVKGWRESDIYAASLAGHTRLAREEAERNHELMPDRPELVQRATFTKGYVVRHLKGDVARIHAMQHRVAARLGGRMAEPDQLRELAQTVNARHVSYTEPLRQAVVVKQATPQRKPQTAPAWAASFRNFEEVKP